MLTNSHLRERRKESFCCLVLAFASKLAVVVSVCYVIMAQLYLFVSLMFVAVVN